jgi:hypothetical protein
MTRHAFPLAAAMLLCTLPLSAQACDPRTEVAVDLLDEPARRIFEELSAREGLTLANAGVLDGRQLTARFKACTMRETFERLSAALGLTLQVRGPELTFFVANADPR